MTTVFTRYCCLPTLSVLMAVSPCRAAGPTGTFVQLNRACAAKTEDAWATDMAQMRRAGIRSIIVQWCAEPGLVYMEGDLPYPERIGAIERILAAAGTRKMKVHLGLFHDPHYWTEITANDTVLRDYLFVRVAQNERIRDALLDRFGDNPAWVGYYIPDELDDLNWRSPDRAALFATYLRTMCDRLRANDPHRSISISAFVRSRTAPDVFLQAMSTIVAASGLDRLLIQDGTGTGDPNERYLPIYYEAFRTGWTLHGTRLACVVEAFTQVSAPNEPFAAVPAAPARVRRQLTYARALSKDIILFTFPDYADPDLGPEAAALYDELTAP